METNIINEGVTLLVLGMGFVFLFLGLLVIAMNAMSVVIARFPTTEAQTTAAPAVAPAPATIDPNTLAAIRAALALHREKNN